MELIEWFMVFYFFLSLYYLSFKYFFAIYNNHFIKKQKTRFYPWISIVIPVYNEPREQLAPCLRSNCLADYPRKEVIVVDDGSSIETVAHIRELQKELGFRLIEFQKNKGKRDAMYAGFMAAEHDILITMDSDTIVPNGKSFFDLVQPLSDPMVGASSGMVLVKNKDDNLLTRIMDARYWIAFQLEKAAQNPYSCVTCCPGPFSAYRKKYVLEYLEEWVNQFFLGVRCTYGDDRGLTTMMLRKYDVKYTSEAVAYTFSPTNLSQFARQQIRWKKSFIRESFFLKSILLKKSFFMSVEYVLFWMVFISGYMAKFLAIALILINPEKFWPYLLMIATVSFFHYAYAFTTSIRKLGFGVLYGFLYEFFVAWLFLPALFNLRDQKWGTR